MAKRVPKFGDMTQDFPKVDRLQNKGGPLPDLSGPPPFKRGQRPRSEEEEFKKGAVLRRIKTRRRKNQKVPSGTRTTAGQEVI